jgi:hypothetical protein
MHWLALSIVLTAISAACSHDTNSVRQRPATRRMTEHALIEPAQLECGDLATRSTNVERRVGKIASLVRSKMTRNLFSAIPTASTPSYGDPG